MSGPRAGIGDKRSAHARQGNNLYQTPTEATTALLVAEGRKVPHRLWEPACGPGAIVRVLRAHGHDVRATDLIDYASPDQDEAGQDFPSLPHVEKADGIVTNPPYTYAQMFVESAIKRAPYVAMLLRLAFLESVKRKELFERAPPARILVFSRRLPMMHQEGYDGPRSGSAMAFAWFVWERPHNKRTVISWLDWQETETAKPPERSVADPRQIGFADVLPGAMAQGDAPPHKSIWGAK